MSYSAFYFPIEISSSDESVRTCDRMAVDDDNSIQLHAAKGIDASINVGDVITYHCPVTCLFRTATVKAIRPDKDCPLLLDTCDLLDKRHQVNNGKKSNNKSFNICQYQLQEEGDYSALTSLFAETGRGFRTKLKTGVEKFWEGEPPPKKSSSKNENSLSPIEDNDEESLSSECSNSISPEEQAQIDAKWPRTRNKEFYQNRLDDHTRSASGLTRSEEAHIKLREFAKAEWKRNYEEKKAARSSLEQSKHSALAETPPRPKVTTKLSTPNHSPPGLSFDSSIASHCRMFHKGSHSSALTPLSESNSMLQTSIIPSPIVTGSQTIVSFAFIICYNSS